MPLAEIEPSFSIIIPVKEINDYVRETVPYIQQFIYHFAFMMIVNNGNGAGHGPAFGENIGHKFLADEVGYGFGAVGVALARDKSVKAAQKFPFKRNPEP